MLTVRREQMDILDQDAERRFRQEMLEHSKAFSPRLCEVIGDQQVQAANAAALERARGYGFSNRGPLRLFCLSAPRARARRSPHPASRREEPMCTPARTTQLQPFWVQAIG